MLVFAIKDEFIIAKKIVYYIFTLPYAINIGQRNISPRNEEFFFSFLCNLHF